MEQQPLAELIQELFWKAQVPQPVTAQEATITAIGKAVTATYHAVGGNSDYKPKDQAKAFQGVIDGLRNYFQAGGTPETLVEDLQK